MPEPVLDAPDMVARERTDDKGRRWWHLTSTPSGQILGSIQWHGPRRAYCFLTVPGCAFNHSCLQAIVKFLQTANEQHRKEKHNA